MLIEATIPDEAEPLIRELAALMSARADDLGPDLADWIHRHVPELGDDEEMRQATRRNAVAHVGALASILRYGIPAGGIEAPRIAVDFARLMVHRRQPIETLLRCYHVGQERLWRQWVDEVFARTDDPALLKALVTWLTDFISTYLDALRETVVRAYVEEEDRWTRSVQAVRERAIRRILARTEADADRAGRELRYDVRRHHVALVVWTRDADADPPLLTGAVDALAAAAGDLTALTVPAALATQWAWISSYTRFTPDALRALTATALPPGVRAATGEPRYGLEGLRESHLQARQAARVVELGAAGDGRPVAFRDVALASVVAGDLPAARRFADAELAPVDTLGDRAPALLATLAAVLDVRGSQRRAAEALGVHEKTIAYRVRRIEEALGHAIAERRAELELALLVRRIDAGTADAVPPTAAG